MDLYTCVDLASNSPRSQDQDAPRRERREKFLARYVKDLRRKGFVSKQDSCCKYLFATSSRSFPSIAFVSYIRDLIVLLRHALCNQYYFIEFSSLLRI